MTSTPTKRYSCLRVICLTSFLAFVRLHALSAQSAPGSKVAVIVNPSVKANEISVDELKAVFLGTKTSLRDGTHLQPVLEKGGPAHTVFLKQYLVKTDFALQTYYRGLVFSGKSPMPPMLGSDADVISYVERTRGAIGYISPTSVADGVKLLQVK